MSESKKEVSEQEAAEIEEQEQEVSEEQSEEELPYQNFNEDELREMLVAREEELSELEQEVNELKDDRLRKVAELENYRKRVKRERSQVYETAKARALEDFLEINDDIQRTLGAAEELDVNETFFDGVQMVAKKLQEILRKNDVQRIDQEGVPFDVDLHDAMMRRKPEDDSIESDIVLNVVESGYRMGDRTIRHAKVIVSE
ncbi:molecular chaperone GrpE [Fodinibius salinus]|uniref:Protein GrpE n=1 Tax=Fodinibius salinus TaxID=860790 RepID=A0A5D3YPI4_9BACT|nr:nucleotide exchange factor GrpE [Fodinibius salinus]TYP94949.1 molecular chaperone GrpE [Fodinibius salinus]